MNLEIEKNKAVQRLFLALDKSILIEEGIKDKWRKIADKLPRSLVLTVCQEIESVNLKINEYIKLALKEDKEGKWMKELDREISEIIKKTKELEENEEIAPIEEKLDEQFKQLG